MNRSCDTISQSSGFLLASALFLHYIPNRSARRLIAAQRVIVRLSAIIITKNEEKNIKTCLDSLRWVDEIIVLDSGSADATVAVCKQYTDQVYETDWPGFGQQKNRALDRASGDWILSLDADEWVTTQLKDEILKIIQNPGGYAAFDIPRLSSYCGRYMHHSGWRPDYVTRLCMRGKARFSEQIVHEKMIVDGKVGRLTNSIMHTSYKDLEQVLDKLNRYSTDGASLLRGEGKQSSLFKAISHGLWSFFYTYIVRAGFLDGRMGFTLAVYNAECTYYKYLKLMMLNKNQP
jgi:glycosyltransferase involved in cell wall biosynthesis